MEVENKTDLAKIGLYSITQETYFAMGNQIAEAINATNLGKSTVGSALDAAANGKGVVNHRLFGHHLISDFPWHSPSQIPDFLEHVLVSDFPTKMGLPIIPGEWLEGNDRLLNAAEHLGRNWNMLNAADGVFGVWALYRGSRTLSRALKTEVCLTNTEYGLRVFSNSVLVGAGIVSANPLLIAAALLDLSGCIVAVRNTEGQVVLVEKVKAWSAAMQVEEWKNNPRFWDPELQINSWKKI